MSYWYYVQYVINNIHTRHTGLWFAKVRQSNMNYLFSHRVMCCMHDNVMTCKCFPHHWPFCEGKPQVTSGLPSERVNNAGLLCFLWCYPGQTVELITVIWGTKMHKRHHHINLFFTASMWYEVLLKVPWNEMELVQKKFNSRCFVTVR